MGKRTTDMRESVALTKRECRMQMIDQNKRKRLLTRAAEQGLVHPKLVRMGAETKDPKRAATAKETLLSAVLLKLRRAPAAQKNYMQRLSSNSKVDVGILEDATRKPHE